jgi:hypothetical protein
VWVALSENEITMFEQYALLIIHIFISELLSKRNIERSQASPSMRLASD